MSHRPLCTSGSRSSTARPRRGGLARRLTTLVLPGTMALALAGAGLVALAPPALAATTVTFSYTGSAQSFTVPDKVYSISVDAFGAQGQDGPEGGSTGGLGGEAQAQLAVTPGQVLQINVGGSGGYGGSGAAGTGNEPAADGGAGGGASDVRQGANGPSDRLVVAGGGGGGGNWIGTAVSGNGGNGGGASGTAGGNGSDGAEGGGAGTASAGGAGGLGANGAPAATGGAPALGGTGGAGASGAGGGGGGGGWFGGGGGGGILSSPSGTVGSAGGGGGSGHGPAGTVFHTGVRSGDGSVSITYTPAAADIDVHVTARPQLGILVPYLRYTLTANNTGPDTAVSATITASLPRGLSATGLPAGCTTSAGTVTCTFEAIASGAGAAKSFDIPLHLLSLGRVSVSATRTASTPTDPNAANDSATADCTVISILLATCS
ncbi:glycine-rich protein [Streptomyces melanogenes]|uniref:glycine-rich protein n=1 Tax=Streptomyces melanogenes TaxID=67326 RepID=UPI00227D7CFE|nr:glycine-rich protein [Streptomyces melanogenes]